jgi:hypothetical protein
LRAAVVALAALALAWLVTAATDEGGISWGERAGRALPLTPGCAAIGTWAALAGSLARGEVRALEALGRSPAQIAASAVLGACAVGFAAAVAIAASHSVDVRGFYPTAARASAWQWEGDAFVNHARGIRVDKEGAPESQPREPAAGMAAIPPGGRAAAALASAAAGLALPMLLAEAMLARRPSRRQAPRRDREGTAALSAALAVSAVAASIILFQAAAARRSPAMVGAIPPALLLAFAARRYRFAA